MCYYLSEWLGITDGFKTIWIEEDREQLKGKGKKPAIHTAVYQRKNIALRDDALTTGGRFRQFNDQMKQRLTTSNNEPTKQFPKNVEDYVKGMRATTDLSSRKNRNMALENELESIWEE